MDIKRKHDRIAVDIAVTLTTVLESLEARIIDLSEQGALVVGAGLSKGAKFQIEYMGQTVYAQCMWSEVDRMGVRFPFDMNDGPLHDALMMAASATASGTPEAMLASPASLAAMPISRRAPSFGRRG